jgi:hypothetical protein
VSFLFFGQLLGAAEPARSAIDEFRHLLDLGNPQLGWGLMALAFVLFAACYRSLHSEPQEQNKFRAWHAMAVVATVLLLIAAWIDAAGVFPRFAFVFLGILLSWLAMEAKDTWRRYSVQPNHFVVIGAVLALLVTIVGMFYTRIKNFDAGETNRFFPVDFAVAAFIAVVTPTAVLLRTLHAAKSWQQEIIGKRKGDGSHFEK